MNWRTKPKVSYPYILKTYNLNIFARVDVEHNKLDKLEKVTNVHNLTGLIKLFFK